MTSSDTKINLVINRLKRHQYENLKQQGKLEENQLYLITDDQSASALISSALSSYYKKTETSSATEIQDAFDNIELTNYYTKSETSSATQLTSEFANYAKLTSLTSNYYTKSETSSATQLTAKFGDYYTKAQVDQISTDLSTQIMQSVPKTMMRRWYSDDATIMQYSDNTTTSKDIVGTLNTSDLGE